MACPKVNPRYPDTAGRPPALPLGVLCRRADPDFDKARRYDVAYEFGRRKRFTEDALFHGAYGLPPSLANDPWLSYGEQDGPTTLAGPFSSDFSQEFETVGPTRADFIAALDAQFRQDNGFCDPFDDGTVTTGTGAGGRNPGAVPSLSTLDAQASIGAVFYGSGSDPFIPAIGDAGGDAGPDAILPVGTAPPDYVRLPPNLAVD